MQNWLNSYKLCNIHNIQNTRTNYVIHKFYWPNYKILNIQNIHLLNVCKLTYIMLKSYNIYLQVTKVIRYLQVNLQKYTKIIYITTPIG